MTTFEKIINAIKQFDLPYAPDIYTGTNSDGWFVYNYADDYGANYADDAPTTTIATVQVHLYLPMKQNFIKIKNAVRKALFEQGFSYADITVLTDVDEKYRHIVFECDTFEDDAI